MSKTIGYILSAAAGLLVLAALVWGSGWLWSKRDAGKVGAAKVVLAPAAVSAPGKPVRAELTLRLPLWRRVKAAEAEPGKNSVLSGAAETASAWRWSYRDWRIAATLRPLGSGECAPGKLRVTLSPGHPDEPGTLEFEIPPITVEAGDPGESATSPLLAAVEPPPQKPNRWHRLWWLLLPLAAGGLALLRYLRRRRRREEAELPPWERARAALLELRSGIAAGRIDPVAGVEVLSDVVRDYLEARFGVPAPRLTTSEFLALVAASPALSAAERTFLREFMNGADLVKFARVPAARAALEDAVGKAELLVERTTPREAENTGTEAHA